MNAVNYQRKLEETLRELQGRPTLLLHACCAPCSSYVLEYLTAYFDILLYYYNPNIAPVEEYERRLNEARRLVREMGLEERVRVIEGAYEPERFEAIAAGLEDAREGGPRCERCFRLRLGEAARAAREWGADYFTTTLTVGRQKNAAVLNAIGQELERACGVRYLCSDFKKRGGFDRSVELCAQYGLYRQDYCGCVYSKRAAQRRHMQEKGEEE